MIWLAFTLTLASHHFREPMKSFQEVNPGVGIEMRWPEIPWYVTAGGYRNSDNHLSVYVAGGREWRIAKSPVTAGVEFGMVSGYEYSLLPLVFPYVTIGTRRVAVKVNVLPVARPIVGIQVRVR